MGAQQSTPSDAMVSRKLVEQFRALELRDEQLRALELRNEKQLRELRDEARQQELQQGYDHVEKTELPPTYRQGSETVSISTTEEWENELMEDPKNRLALSALTSLPLNEVVSQKTATLSDTQVFNVQIPFEGSPVTNQRSSGRCWLFASLNVHRVAIMKKHNLKEFQFSQAYPFFWDKLEKSNYFLESILDTSDEDLDSRLVQTLLRDPTGDGGQWDMFVNLVRKYGLVPQSLYPDSFNAMNSSAMDRLITTKLRENALILRSMKSSSHTSRSSLLATKDKMLQEMHLILTIMLGPPPNPNKLFTWEYFDASGKYRRVSKTPLQFASELSDPSATAIIRSDVNSLFSLVNDPRNEYNTLLSVSRLGNVVEGFPIRYVNVPMSTMKVAAIAMLRAGLPVMFGSDVGKFSDSKTGVMDTALYDYGLAFNVELNMTKTQRLVTGESAMTHAMVLTAVQIDSEGKPERWRVMNSWGENAGEKGFFVMSDAWMDQFCYQVVVDPRYVTKEIRAILEKGDPKVLPLWDPMGALA